MLPAHLPAHYRAELPTHATHGPKAERRRPRFRHSPAAPLAKVKHGVHRRPQAQIDTQSRTSQCRRTTTMPRARPVLNADGTSTPPSEATRNPSDANTATKGARPCHARPVHATPANTTKMRPSGASSSRAQTTPSKPPRSNPQRGVIDMSDVRGCLCELMPTHHSARLPAFGAM